MTARVPGMPPRPGDGVVSNEALMATAGAAPVVNPDPAAPAADLAEHEFDQSPVGGATGLESLDIGAGRVTVDAIRHGVELALGGSVGALVTGPSHKPAIQAAG